MSGPLRISLFEAREKARWAEHHYEVLRPEIEAFRNRDDHRITVDVNAETGQYEFRVFDLPSPEPDWGLRIGDCLHNARSALDYLMVRLYALATEQDAKDVEAIQFPVCDKPERWNSSPSVQKFRKEHPLSGYLARIEELQPYNMHNPSVWGLGKIGMPEASLVPGALAKLSAWDNLDKHRVIHAAWLGGALKWAEPPVPPGFKSINASTTYGALEDGAVIGHWTFETPLPRQWTPTEVEMKRYFPIDVAIDEPIQLVTAVLIVLPLCLWTVKAVLDLFEPVFSEGKPPLPVTTTLPSDE
jgi:hypothetical protein